MKAILVTLLVGLAACSALAQTNATPAVKHHKKKGATNDTASAADPTAAPASDPVADQVKMVQQYQKLFVPSDPYRVMNGQTNFARGADWVQFEGRVIRTASDGLVLQGWYGEPLAYMLPASKSPGAMTMGLFVLSGFPRAAGVGQFFSRNERLVAMKSGNKDDLVNLEYGSVYVPEMTEEQKQAAVDAKSKTEAKVLAWQKERAEGGDAYGEYKMGVRYLKGDGVEKDLAKARDLLTKSAAQGNSDAAGELAKLPASN